MKPILSIAISGAMLCGILNPSHGQQATPYEELPATGTIATNAVVKLEPTYPSAPLAPTVNTSPSPSVNFQGLDDNNTAIPPDTHGAVGPSHVVTMLNTQVRIADRTGSTNYSTTTLSNWWSSAGSFATVFDPKVVYEPYSARWIATVCADSPPNATNSAIILAVSQGTDPTGGWYWQKVDADANNVLWADYPSLGFNKDWIAINFNMFTNGGKFSHSRLYVFNKTNTYAGGTTRTLIDLPQHLSATIVPAITYDNSVGTLYCLQNWNGAFTNSQSLVKGFLRFYSITGSISSPNINTNQVFPATEPWSSSPSVANFAPQANSSVAIQNNDARIQNVVFRNGSIWATHTVFYPHSGPTRSAVQWWQLSTAGSIQQVGRVDDQSGVNFYSFPSISVNKFNDALLGFSSFSTNQYASANYTFRAFDDGANTMRTIVTLKAGEGVYYKTGTGTRNRLGDYRATMVDPVNDADFWTIQEYAATPADPSYVNNNGRWGVWWGKIVASTPANDNFANATTLTGIEGTNNSTLFRATREKDESNHAGVVGGRSIWFNWTPATNGWVAFDTLQSTTEINTMIGVYTGSGVNALTEIASNDDYRFRPRSFVYFNAIAATTYRIAVDAKDSSSEVADAITLVWHQSIPPWFVAQPFDVHILAGSTLVLTSMAVGQPPPIYQWQTNGVNISSATHANYTNTNPQSTTTNAPTTRAYTAIASNSSGSRTSLVAHVTVYPSATATLSEHAYLSGNKFKLTVTGIPGYNYIVQATTNFTNWVSLHTNTSSFSYTNDASTNYLYRFFRSIY